MSSVSLQSLRVFLLVVEHGSVSAAGREAGISQPAVSNHLHALEERFGVALLGRGRPMRLTPAGECLAGHGRKVLEEVRALETEMSFQAAPRGNLVVASSTTPAELLMPAVAARFAARYPEVVLKLLVSDTEETLGALLERRVEVAVVGREVSDERLECRTVEEDRLVAVVAAGSKPAPEMSAREFAGMPLIFRERGSATRLAVEEALTEAGLAPKVAMELGSNTAVAGAVAAGAGVGVVPERAARRSPGLERLKVRGLDLRRPLVLVTERGKPLSPAAAALVETFVETSEETF